MAARVDDIHKENKITSPWRTFVQAVEFASYFPIFQANGHLNVDCLSTQQSLMDFHVTMLLLLVAILYILQLPDSEAPKPK